MLSSTASLPFFKFRFWAPKMEAALLEFLQQAKEAGSSASLSFTTVGGTMKAKFEIELPSTGASPASQSPTATSSAPIATIVVAAAVDAIVDQQPWHARKREQWLTRPSWQCHHRRPLHLLLLPPRGSSRLFKGSLAPGLPSPSWMARVVAR